MKLKPYPKYKPSGVEWLGNVPEHWKVRRLKFVVSINDDTLAETTSPDYEMEYVDIGSVNAVDGITTRETFIFENAPSRARRRVQHGDTIVSTVRTYLRAIAPINHPAENLVVSTGFAVIRPRKANSEYLSYALREPSFVESVVSRSVGVSYPAVNASEIADISIPLPEAGEQRFIAAFLDRETGRIDRLVVKKRELIERLKEKRTALISRTVARGLPPDAARATGLPTNPRLKPSGIDWLGNIPEHWEVKRLGFLCVLESGENITSEVIAEGGDFPVYGGNGFRGYYHQFTHDGHFVLIGRQGALCGNINYGNGKFWASEHALIVIPTTQWDVVWMGELLRSMNLGRHSVTAAQPGLAAEMLRRLRVPVPPLREQTAIAKYLNAETAKLDALVTKVEEAIERLQEYRTALITAAVTGKIDVREEVSS